jgi:putative spermidine/putrescine transport system ATP-binding protein
VTRFRGKALNCAEPVSGGAGAHFLILRPELVELRSAGAAAVADVNELEGVARDVIFQGDSVLVLVDLGEGQEIGVRVPANRTAQAGLPAPGATIRLGLHRSDTLVVPEAAS